MSEIKVIVRTQSGQLVSRLSPWAKYVWQPPKELHQGSNYKQLVWNPPPHEVRWIIQMSTQQFNFDHNNLHRVLFSSISILKTGNRPSQNRYGFMSAMLALPQKNQKSVHTAISPKTY